MKPNNHQWMRDLYLMTFVWLGILWSGDILSRDIMSQDIYCPGTICPRDNMSPLADMILRGLYVPGDILSRFRGDILSWCSSRATLATFANFLQLLAIFGGLHSISTSANMYHLKETVKGEKKLKIWRLQCKTEFCNFHNWSLLFCLLARVAWALRHRFFSPIKFIV